MKKILSTLALLACVSFASAEVVAHYDFEGEFKPLKVWGDTPNKVVGANLAKDSQKAIEVKTGTYLEFHVQKPKTSYTLTLDMKHMWGKNPPRVVVAGIDPDLKKLADLKYVDVTIDKNYQKITLKFKTKVSGYHRVTIIPGLQSGGCVIVDNLKLESK
ncbi:MAG: hypothetical protein SNH13_05730 [Rikenellaceae bacterium]